jgi:zinc/manganese transport system substrate-binding protein
MKLSAILPLIVLAASPALAAPLPVTASFSILGDMVQQVGGDKVAVTTIVGPNADTHVYEPTPGDVQKLLSGQVFFVNGLGFEGWMERLVQSSGFKGQVVVASTGLAPRQLDEDGKTVADPHAWQSLGNGLIYVENIRAALCAADSADCASFTANATAYAQKIAALDAQVKAEIGAVPTDKRKVITTHDAFGYFGAEYGVTFLAAEGLSTDAEPSASGLAQLVTQVKAESVKAIFLENMSDPRILEQISREAGVTIGGELFADALTPPEGGGAHYLELVAHNAQLLVAGMQAAAK